VLRFIGVFYIIKRAIGVITIIAIAELSPGTLEGITINKLLDLI